MPSSPEIVAELGASHCGDIDKAHALITAAKQAGASAVKLQCWSPGSMCLDPEYIVPSGPWAGMHLQQLYEQAWMPWDWFGDLVRHCNSIDLPWFSSVYDVEALAFLERLGCLRYKIASFEIVDIPLIEEVARTNKPVVISTGVASDAEIASAYIAARYSGSAGRITLLHCVSEYPCDVKDAALHRIGMLKEHFVAEVGLSDHSPGWLVPVLAVAQGVSMIEKHLKLEDSPENLDDGFALKPLEFYDLVQRVREAAAALSRPDGVRHRLSSASLRRSLYVAQDASPGDSVIGKVRSARPAEGLALQWWPKIQDMRFVGHAEAGTPLKMDMLTL